MAGAALGGGGGREVAPRRRWRCPGRGGTSGAEPGGAGGGAEGRERSGQRRGSVPCVRACV